MVNRTFLKECIRAVRSSISRFLAIFAIVALGSGFLAGLLATTPDMRHTVSELYARTNLFDLRVVGNLGLEDRDAEALLQVPGVKAAMAARIVDREILLSTGDSLVGRFHAVTAWESEDDSVMNRPVLHEGRWPQSDDECVVEVSSELYQGALDIGSTLTLLPMKADGEDEAPEETFRHRELTIVGTVTSGYYVSMAQRGSTTLGSGRLGCIVYVRDSLLDLDYYTDIFLVTEDGRQAEAFTEAYEDLIAPVQQAVEDAAETQKYHRADKLRGDAQKELDDARQELADKTAEGEQELADALKELQDGEQEYADGLRELEDGRKELADGEREFEEGLADFAEGKAEYEDGLADFREGEQELADALVELEDGEAELADALKELNDGEAELADGLKELQDGEAELPDALKKLEDGEKEYADGLQEIADAEQEIADGQAELDEAYQTIQQAKRELKDAKFQLDNAQRELDAGRKELDAGQAAVDAGQAQLDQIRANYDEQLAAGQIDAMMHGLIMSQLDAQQKTIDENQKKLDAGYVSLNRGQDELDEGWVEYEKNKEQVDDADVERRLGLIKLDLAREDVAKGKQELADARKELDDGWAEYEQGKLDLAEGWKAYNDGRKELDDGWTEYNDGRKELDDGWAEYRDGLAELEEARVELEDAKKTLAEAEQELVDAQKDIREAKNDIAEGEQELADARIELDDGWKEYEDGKVEFEEKIADANLKIRDAQEEIDGIDEPEWYVLTRGESNESYIFYDSDTEKVSAIAKVFPVFFFLVAALVASTTMTRMIDEDRGTIGTLKALGYSNGAIAGKYLLYAAMACVLGAAFGLSIFLPLIPRIIANVYTMMYQIPPLEPAPHAGFILLSAGLILAAVLVATLGALKGALQDNAAALMRPKAPPAGKRILLERIRPLWRRMKFTHKVTARNLFRYKKRFLMTVIGVAGCTALLVAGFGLRDSIGDIVNIQFTQLQQYDLTVTLEHEGDDTANRAIRRVLADKERVADYLTVHSETGEGTSPGRDTALTIVVPSDIEAYGAYHVFRDRESGEAVPFTAEGAVLTEKAAKVLGIEEGGSLTLRNQDETEAVIPISGICENYVQGYVFLSRELYEDAFGEECVFDTVFAKTTAADEQERNALAEALLDSDDVSGLSFSTATIETFDDMLASIDYIVILLIVAAAALAFVVLYNLTNINICERQKEIATLKVLGFYKREVSGYIFRETMLLSVIGTAVGLAVGMVFHRFVVLTAEVDAVMFGRVVRPMSYVYSGVLSLLFTLLVSLLMQKKLHRIDMVESLKAPE